MAAPALHDAAVASDRDRAPPACARARRRASRRPHARRPPTRARASASSSQAPMRTVSWSASATMLGAARGVERRIDLGEIPDMRAVQDGGAELGGLDRILPAMLDQRAADEHDRRQPIDQAELADRVGDIDLGVAVRQFAARAQRDLQARGARRSRRCSAPRSGWRGAIKRQQAGKAVRSRRCASMTQLSSPDASRRRRSPAASPMAACSAASLAGIGRRRRHVELEIAGRDDSAARRARRSARRRRRIAQGRDRSGCSRCADRARQTAASAGTSAPTAGR